MLGGGGMGAPILLPPSQLQLVPDLQAINKRSRAVFWAINDFLFSWNLEQQCQS